LIPITRDVWNHATDERGRSTTDHTDATDKCIRVIRITIYEDVVLLGAFLVIHLGNHLLALISTYSESVPISDHQWLKTPLLGYSVAAAPRRRSVVKV